MSRFYSKDTINNYALYSAVRIIDFENDEFCGWLVPDPHNKIGYMILPLSYTESIFHIKRSHIKKVYHLTNNYLIPKEVK